MTFDVLNDITQVDMLAWMSRTALELIGQAGMGYSFDDLEDEANAHPYVQAIKGLSCVPSNSNIVDQLTPLCLALSSLGISSAEV